MPTRPMAVFEDERAVTYETVGDDCQRCKVVTVEF